MATEKQTDNELEQLLQDIRLVNQAAKAETTAIDTRLRQRLGEAALPEPQHQAVVAALVSELGQLTARVDLNAKAIRGIKPAPTLVGKSGSKPTQHPPRDAVVSFSASQLADNKNLLYMESAPNGVNYCWSGADTDIEFVFSLDRGKPLEMQVRLFALIKPEYSKQLKVFVDGQYTRHLFAADGSLYVVSCVIPATTQPSPTEVRISLPATHSPSEMGDSQDYRKLGIAISEIRFQKPEHALNRLLKQLKLKK